MKSTPSSQKISQHKTSDDGQRASAGPAGTAITPPASGIENLDLVSSPQAIPLQMKAGLSAGGSESKPQNHTGLPDTLKTGIESLSGLSLDDVQVTYNSSKPAGLQALAYTQGTNIHVGPGQERHLPHEAWHVVQQKQGRVRATLQAKGVGINADVGLEHDADVMGSRAKAGDHQTGTLQHPAPRRTEMGKSSPVQRVIEVGAAAPFTTYTTYGGNATKALVKRLDAALATAGKKLRIGWKKAVSSMAAETDPTKTQRFVDEDAILAALEPLFQPVKGNLKRKKDIEEQDANIVKLTSGADAEQRKRAKVISDHSEKAFGKFTQDLAIQKEYAETMMELEALTPAEMSANSDVKTNSPAIFFAALGTSGENKKLDRMDFNFSATEVMTHGFESPGQRDIAPKGTYTTKKGAQKKFQDFNYNTVKIGNDIGTYAKHQSALPATLQNEPIKGLNTLEKFRLQPQALGTSIKRDFHFQNLFTTEQAFGQNHPHSSVEFLGATSGSGLNNNQYAHMVDQQSLSNINIIETAYASHPDQPIGFDTKDGKVRTTPREIHDSLESWMASKPKDPERKKKKRLLRKRVKRAIISSENIPGVNSDDDVSDVGL